MEFRFAVVNLSSWLDRWPELEAAAAHNPFAVVVMAQLLAHARGIRGEARLHGKLRLTRMLYDYGYARQDVLELYRLIDWMVSLPPAQEIHFVEASEQLEKEREMPFVLTAERVWERRGREQGRQEGELALLRRQLVRRFGPLPQWAEARIDQAASGDVLDWADRVLDAATLEDVLRTRA